MKRIAYLGKIQLSDVDLSYLHEAQQIADITYIMEVSPRFLKGPAFDIAAIYPRTGLFKAMEAYPEVCKFCDFIDLEKFYVLNTSGRWWQLKSFWTYFLLLLFLLRGKFDVIHLAWPPNVYEFAIYLLRRRMLLTVHDPFPHTGLDTRIVRLRRKVAFRLIPSFNILNSRQRQEFMDFYHLSADRVIDSRMSSYTYLNTVKPDMTAIPASGSYILFAGKVSPYKGLDYLLPAMTEIHAQCPDCKLIVAGGGSYHFDINAYMQVEYIDIRNRFIPDSELVALLKNASFIVCPYTDATQSGVIMSAFAFNKPVIATNVGGLPEMLCGGRCGMIVKEKDTEALVKAIVMLWCHSEKQKYFAEQIKTLYGHGDLSWRRIAEKLYEEYTKVASNE